MILSESIFLENIQNSCTINFRGHGSNLNMEKLGFSTCWNFYDPEAKGEFNQGIFSCYLRVYFALRYFIPKMNAYIKLLDKERLLCQAKKTARKTRRFRQKQEKTPIMFTFKV